MSNFHITEQQSNMNDEFSELLKAYDVLNMEKSTTEDDIQKYKEINLFQEEKNMALEDQIANMEKDIENVKQQAEIEFNDKTQDLRDEIFRLEGQLECIQTCQVRQISIKPFCRKVISSLKNNWK